MKVKHELTKKYGPTSWIENFGETKSLRSILGRLKSNVGIFRWTIYLFNPFLNKKIQTKNITNKIHRIIRKKYFNVLIYIT